MTQSGHSLNCGVQQGYTENRWFRYYAIPTSTPKLVLARNLIILRIGAEFQVRNASMFNLCAEWLQVSLIAEKRT